MDDDAYRSWQGDETGTEETGQDFGLWHGRNGLESSRQPTGIVGEVGAKSPPVGYDA
jgi:hypothetical protein